MHPQAACFCGSPLQMLHPANSTPSPPSFQALHPWEYTGRRMREAHSRPAARIRRRRIARPHNKKMFHETSLIRITHYTLRITHCTNVSRYHRDVSRNVSTNIVHHSLHPHHVPRNITHYALLITPNSNSQLPTPHSPLPTLCITARFLWISL